jgi:uncharacterized protein (PEP-CTERM system associated)
MDLRHQSRRTVWTASYSETVTTSRNILLEREVFTLVDPFGQPIRDPTTGQPIQVAIDLPTLNEDVLVRGYLQGAVSLQGRRSTATLRIFTQTYEYQDNADQNQDLYGLTLSLSRTLPRAITARLYGTWQQSTFDTQSESDYQYWDLWLTLTHQFSDHLSGSVNVGHQQQNSDQPLNEYRENRIGAFMTVTF